jgi:hypothetical protein
MGLPPPKCGLSYSGLCYSKEGFQPTWEVRMRFRASKPFGPVHI